MTMAHLSYRHVSNHLEPSPSTTAPTAPSGERVSDDAIAAAYDRSRCRLRRLASKWVPAGDADDLVQEAFLRVLKHRERFRGESTIDTWLHRVVINAGIDATRQRRRRPERDATPDSMLQPAGVAPLDRMHLRIALGALPPEERKLCVL